MKMKTLGTYDQLKLNTYADAGRSPEIIGWIDRRMELLELENKGFDEEFDILVAYRSFLTRDDFPL